MFTIKCGGKLFYMTLFLFFLASCAISDDTDEITLLDKKMDNILKKYDIPGLSVLVLKNNQIVYEHYSGFSDIERQIPVTPETCYRIASISKFAVATALMRLFEEKRLELNEDVSRYLGFTFRNPKFPDQIITLTHLLTHTSGLSDSDAYFRFLMDTYDRKNPSIISLFTEKSAYYATDTWNGHAPGAWFEYSNLGFGVIGNLIEKVSGQRFDIYMKGHLLEPLGITGSFNVHDLQNIDHLSVLYRREELDINKPWIPQTDHYKGIRPPPRQDILNYSIGHNGIEFGPQGSLRASARDLAKILSLHLNNGSVGKRHLLSSESVELMQHVHFGGDETQGYKKMGLSTHVVTDLVPGETLYGHSGDAYGLHSLMYFNPEKNYGFVVIMNGAVVEEGSSGFLTVEEEITRLIFSVLGNQLLARAIGN